MAAVAMSCQEPGLLYVYTSSSRRQKADYSKLVHYQMTNYTFLLPNLSGKVFFVCFFVCFLSRLAYGG